MSPQPALLWLDRLAAMTVKELRQVSRDPTLLLVILYFFTADIYIAGSGIRMDLHHAPIVVMDHDKSAASRELIYRFRSPYFSLQGEVADGSQAMQLLDQGKTLAVLDIPPHFQRRLLKGEPVDVQLQVDAANATLGTLASSYASQIVSRFGTDFALRQLGMGDAAM